MASASQDCVLSTATITMIKCTSPAIKTNGDAIIGQFHKSITQNHPVFKTIFPEDSIKDEQMMSSMVSSLYNYATHCDNLPVLENEISDLVGMAVNMGVEDWHYPLIAEAITEAIRVVLVEQTNTEILAAWNEGLSFLAEHFVKLAEEFIKNPYYKSWRLSEETVQILKQSAAEVKEKGVAVATHMYKILFERYPVFKSFFPMENISKGKMITVLPHALHAFAVNCDDLMPLEDTISRIVHRHVNQGTQDWHYPMLEECLVEALNIELSLSTRPTVLQAWKEGFKYLANKIMKLEDIRRNNPTRVYKLTSKDIATLKSTAPSFKRMGSEVISHFYKILFERYPVFKSMFKEENVNSGKQVAAMVKVLHMFAANCDNMCVLDGAVSHIVGRHVGRKLGVEGWHYPIVGECLIEAIRVVFDKDATPQLLDAWTNGYRFLSAHFIKLEEEFKQNPYYQTWELSEDTITVLKSTGPIIKEKGMDISSRLYEILFTRYEVFKTMFPEETIHSGKMHTALPNALHDFAMNCDNMTALEDTVTRVAQRHVTSGVQDWHYPMLEECLKEAICLILADDATPDILAAWNEGFKYLANQIMKQEDLKRTSMSSR